MINDQEDFGLDTDQGIGGITIHFTCENIELHNVTVSLTLTAQVFVLGTVL